MFNEIIQTEVGADMITFNAEMIQDEVKPNTITFNDVISNCEKAFFPELGCFQ